MAFIQKVLRQLRETWIDDSGYIFGTSLDAIGGLFVLIILPVISLFTTLANGKLGWINYMHPLLTICLAGIYDSNVTDIVP
jgi:hypothetical protein